ncbi:MULTISPECIES: electron transfer flavoprotein subunit alpha/FixB family protein [Prauserella salsuginis group]|uniref:Electron transfer flavoprotein subunit alpha/FixB family protein n=1 Tax=Prauserella salsuginis TaxID=387889 RepID=A0ABW6GBH3_9PSEU|nr:MULTISPECIES: electron transfer flavoprotein subunit alpha/FixB family protein [Prauserella salsuginis group]MCR3722858.1 electron transfer flavoprotein alpha subunit [Prauserella flava]MCR3737467.1 electron transfer flavoprotein alpha subunit [Prauserella salsuginis]
MQLVVVADAAVVPELPAVARSVAGRDEAVEAVTFAGVEVPAGDLARELGGHGVARLHVVRHELLDDYAPEAWGSALATLIDRLGPSGVLAPATHRGTEILTHAAARAGLPLATNCVRLTADDASGHGGAGDGTWRLTRTRSGGVLLEDAELTAPVRLATVAAAVETPQVPLQAADCEVVESAVDVPPELARTRVAERVASETGLSLSTAPVVVSGGRGVGGADGFVVLEELAERLGGVVGCSRVATNNGWRPHRDQVGLTGTKIAADLYIACGISGATQHWVGCMDSAVILAINTDPEAPMMQRATYAVEGDVHEVVPAVLAEIRRRGGAAAAAGSDRSAAEESEPAAAPPVG